MPAPLAIPLGLAAGSALAWLAASAPPTAAAGSDARARTTATYFGAFVLGPAVAVLEAAAMPWANLYVADLPSAGGLLVAIAAGVAPIAGERLARARLDRGDARTPVGVALAGVVTTLLGAAIARHRIEVVASQRAHERDLGGAELFTHRAGAALVLAVLAVAVGYAFALRALSVAAQGEPRRATPPSRRGRGMPLGPRS